jgi:hypothetical protein
MIINDASTINVIDDASLALASIVNYDRKWRYNLERHFDDTMSVNYDRNTFIIQATGVIFTILHYFVTYEWSPKKQDFCPWQAFIT